MTKVVYCLVKLYRVSFFNKYFSDRVDKQLVIRTVYCTFLNALIAIAVPGMLEYESIPGVSSSKPFGGRSKAHADITVKSITEMVSCFKSL